VQPKLSGRNSKVFGGWLSWARAVVEVGLVLVARCRKGAALNLVPPMISVAVIAARRVCAGRARPQDVVLRKARSGHSRCRERAFQVVERPERSFRDMADAAKAPFAARAQHCAPGPRSGPASRIDRNANQQDHRWIQAQRPERPFHDIAHVPNAPFATPGCEFTCGNDFAGAE
jgi:hypothetical protein